MSDYVPFEPAGSPLTLVAADSLLQSFRVAPSRGFLCEAFLVKNGNRAERQRGRIYKERSPKVEHAVLPVEGGAGILSAGGWNPAEEDFTTFLEFFFPRFLSLGVPSEQVTVIYLVLGINSIRGSLNGLYSEQESLSVATAAAKGIHSVVGRLLSLYPSAEVVYLGAGRLWSETPSWYSKKRVGRDILEQVNRIAGWLPEWLGNWFSSDPLFSRALVVPDFWNGWQDSFTRDHFGHFTPRGTSEFRNRLGSLIPLVARGRGERASQVLFSRSGVSGEVSLGEASGIAPELPGSADF
jgi:hypothetical protein